jgi:hypothetical protein
LTYAHPVRHRPLCPYSSFQTTCQEKTRASSLAFAAGAGACVGLARVPRAVRIAGSVAILLAVAVLVNLVYHVILKPTELFAFIGHRLDKEPAETWQQYGPLFRSFSTSTITPELLAALAQPARRMGWSEAIPINFHA